VLDPFAGTASAGVAAYTLGCAFIGFDKDEDLLVSGSFNLRRLVAKEEYAFECALLGTVVILLSHV
jgi:tRNA G10  N-methylase Trm11